MTGSEIKIRAARPVDAGQLAKIYGPHCTDGIASFETVAPTADEMAERVRSTSASHPWLVAVGPNDEVDGYAYGSRHRDRPGYRWSVDVTVYVAAAGVGRGIGRALYERLLLILERQGFHRAYAGIALPNDASVALHRSCGFEPVGVYREVGWKHGVWLDVQWWSRPLADPAGPPAEPISFADLPAAVLADLTDPGASLPA